MPDPTTEPASSEEDDAPLVAAAVAGDMDAFERLVRLHQRAIRGFLAARLANPDDAEDLAQEVFVVAFRRRRTFSGDRPIGAWFRGIARNLLSNYIRKFRAKPVGGSAELQSMIDNAADATQAEGDMILALRECLAELDGPARDLVVARYLDGQSVRQIESRTGRGYSALTMQLHRIRGILALCVEEKLGYAPNPSR